MIANNWLRTNRDNLFPYIKDWKSAQDDLRYGKNIKKMDFNKWLFFHYSAYLLIYYGGRLISICILAGLIFLTAKRSLTAAIILSLVAAYMAYDLVKNLLKYRIIRGMNLYDHLLKDH